MDHEEEYPEFWEEGAVDPPWWAVGIALAVGLTLQAADTVFTGACRGIRRAAWWVQDEQAD
jgi:hypothetical protein